MYMGGTPIGEIIADFDRNKKKSIQLLNAAVSVLNERMEDLVDTPRQLPVAVQSVPKQDSSNRKVFIVHGQDEGAKQAVARQLERSACVPVILHEQPNGGKTIIEKFEHNADVGFAVVLLTPDDIVTDQQGKLAKRARQNVILELGYFVGRLGRSKVMAIKKGDVDLPSDIHGVVWVEMDEYDGWKVKLAKELKSAGYPIDLNNII